MVAWSVAEVDDTGYRQQHFGGTFIGGRVQIDDAAFTDCSFTDNTLVYSGGRPPLLHNCVIANCRWSFEGPAENTVSFLSALAQDNGGGMNVVLRILLGLSTDSLQRFIDPSAEAPIDTNVPGEDG